MPRRTTGPAAFSTIGEKTSAGRNTHTTVKVSDVETLPCPGGGHHVLVNDSRARTTCRGCGETWAALDAEVRE